MEFRLILVLIVSSYTGLAANDICNQPSKPNDTFEPWRRPYLPQTIQPVLYNLSLVPDFYYNKSSLSGNIYIEFKVTKATNTILLHNKGLRIDRTTINGTTCVKSVKITRTFTYNDYWVIETNETMEASNCTTTLYLTFNGNLTLPSFTQSTAGVFKSKYVNKETQKESWLTATHFQPHYSRFAFPCFDEPQFKAPFLITLRHWLNFTALSNMKYKKRPSYETHWMHTIFEVTPPMSSYLVTFIITNFAYKTSSLAGGKKIRFWVRRDRFNEMEYASDASRKALNYLQREFDLAYPLDKLDQVALPEFTPDGASSLGLNVYKESMILVDVNKAGYAEKQRALSLVAHGLAHIYFGNLVTCRYWNHLWLNEGLATYYGILASDDVDPNLLSITKYLTSDLEYVMAQEADSNTKALVSALSSPDEEKGLFDSIRYTKGVAILRMVKHFMGLEKFKSGIRRYLRDNLYKTVETSHLWAALQQEINDSSLNLEEVMKNWVYKEGFPVVLVLPLPGNRLLAIQERFLNNRPAVQDCRYTWHIPLSYHTKGGSTGLVWLKQTHVTFNVTLNSPGDWIQFNRYGAGYYRVNYHETLWERLVNQLNENFKVFNLLTRWQLLSDAFNLAKSGHVSYVRFLSLTKYASKDRAVQSWTYVTAFYDVIKKMISNTTSFSLFQRHILNLTSSFMNELGVKDEGTNENRALRPMLMSLSCSAGHRGCIENTTKMFKEWIRNETASAIPVQYKKFFYCIGVANSVLESDWNTVYERFKVAALQEDKYTLVEALACSRNATLLKRLLGYAINDTRMRFSERYYAFIGIASNSFSEDCVFKWLQLNYADANVEARRRRSRAMIYAIAKNIVTREQRDKVLNFLKNFPILSDDDRPYYLGIMKKNIDWIDKNLPGIASWLERNVLDY